MGGIRRKMENQSVLQDTGIFAHITGRRETWITTAQVDKGKARRYVKDSLAVARLYQISITASRPRLIEDTAEIHRVFC